MLGELESLYSFPLKEMKMKAERVYRNYHGEFINSRVVKGLRLAEAVYASKLELPKHLHPHGGFCLVLQGSYTESYGKTLLECEPESVKFQLIIRSRRSLWRRVLPISLTSPIPSNE